MRDAATLAPLPDGLRVNPKLSGDVFRQDPLVGPDVHVSGIAIDQPAGGFERQHSGVKCKPLVPHTKRRELTVEPRFYKASALRLAEQYQVYRATGLDRLDPSGYVRCEPDLYGAINPGLDKIDGHLSRRPGARRRLKGAARIDAPLLAQTGQRRERPSWETALAPIPHGLRKLNAERLSYGSGSTQRVYEKFRLHHAAYNHAA